MSSGGVSFVSKGVMSSSEVEQVKLGERAEEVWDPAGERVLAEVEHTECGREHGEVRWHDTGEMVPKE
jgi:hypothetical protein